MKGYILSALLWAWRNRKRLFLFFCIGSFCTALHTGILVLVYKELGFHYQVGNGLGFGIALAANFWLNKRFTFGIVSNEELRREGPRFLVKKGVFYPASVVALHVLVEHGGMEPWMAHVALIPVFGFLGFLVLEKYVFTTASGH